MNQCTTVFGSTVVAYAPMTYLWLEQDGTVSVSSKSPSPYNVCASGDVDSVGLDMIAVHESNGEIKNIRQAKQLRLQK